MDTCCVFDISRVPGFIDVMKNNFDETLKINRINYKTKRNDYYYIIRYNKNFITKDNIPDVGIIKSVVFNDALEAVGFAPAKSIDFSIFKNLYPVKNDYIIAEEFVEGAMINLFWNSKINIDGGWEISTRNTVGGEIFCNNKKPKKTYADLFKDTIKSSSLDINELNKSYCYSFVMRHPGFINISQPELYLVEIFEIVQTLKEIILVFQMNLNVIKNKINCLKESKVKFPKQYDNWSNYDELKDIYASINARNCCKGVILRNINTGERSKILNPLLNYTKIILQTGEKELLKYLLLRKEGKVKESLKLHPENKKSWNTFRKYIHDFTFMLHKKYIDYYVKRCRTIESLPELLQRHLQNLHEIYIHTLRIKNLKITLETVTNYVNTMNSEVLLYCLVSPLREE